MKTFTKIVFLILTVCSLNEGKAQIFLNWQRFINGNAALTDSATCMEVEDDGVMIGCNMNNTGTGLDAIIHKYNTEGIWQWSGGYISANPDEVQGFQCNGFDDMYAVGSTGSSQNRDGLLFKLDENGNNIWSKTFNGGYGDDEFLNLKIAPDNTIVVVGETMVTSFQCNAYIAKYDASGNLKWSKTPGGQSGENELNDLEIDTNGNIFASGYYYNGVNRDGFIVKYSPTGKILKTLLINGAGNKDDEVKSIELENGILYVATVGRGSGLYDVITITAYNPTNFSVIWTNTSSAKDADLSIVAGGFQCDAFGDLYLAGIQDDGLHSEYLALSYDALTGIENWSKTISADGYNYNNAVACTLDTKGNFIITGVASLQDFHKSEIVVATQGQRIFTVAYDHSGIVAWTKLYNGPNNENNSPAAIGADNKGNLYIAGLYESNGDKNIVTLKYSETKICYVPTGLYVSALKTTQAKLNWEPMPEATKYKVQYRSVGGSWISVNSKTYNLKLTSLMANTTYEWRVKTICSNNPSIQSEYSAIQQFTTQNSTNLSFDFSRTDKQENFHIYPNPANKTVCLHLKNIEDANVQVSIHDLTGKEIKRAEFVCYNKLLNEQLDISALLPGSYIIKITGKYCNYSQILIKQ
jgi:hypothetical protein